MKNTNSREFKEALKAYLEPIIRQHAEEYGEDAGENPFLWAVNLAKREVGHEFERNGEHKGMEYWLSGLGLSVAYTYADIVSEAEKMHDCKMTEKEADKVCENWFRFLAAKILQFSRQ